MRGGGGGGGGGRGGGAGGGGGLTVPARERGREQGRLKETMLTAGPGLSAGEREGKGEEVAGSAWPKKRKGSAGVWAKRLRER